MRLAHPCRHSYLIAAVFLVAGGGRAETYHNWCTLYFDGAQTAAGLASPLRDLDGDGTANVIEYLADTDPWDPNSRLRIQRDTAPETVSFSLAPDREDVVSEVVVSPDLLAWSEEAVHLCAGPQPAWHLNGFPFVKVGVKRRIGYVIDSDQDGLDDYFEEALAAADACDGLTHIGEVLPADDFENNGTANLDESANAPPPLPGGSFAPPPLIDPTALNCALQSVSSPAPQSLKVHTPLR